MIINESYTLPQLREWIKSTLGSGMVRLEGLEARNSEALDAAISASIMEYSSEIPMYAWEMIKIGVSKHKISRTPIYGVIKVEFLEPLNAFGMGATGYGLTQNLTGVVTPPILSAGGVGLGDIQQFITWRKSFQRVTSRQPNWVFMDETNEIVIYNPVNYIACALMTVPRRFENIRLQHKMWVANTALARAKISLGEVRSKFELSGPGGSSLGLKGDALKKEGEEALKAQQEKLKGMRPRGFALVD